MIERIKTFEEAHFAQILEDSQTQGYRFVQKFVMEYMNGTNRFDQPGESFFSAIVDGNVVGIGGLNIDPYLKQSDVGRVRHLYIHSSHRGQGISKELLKVIIDSARNRFSRLTLYTENPVADNLYRSFGFMQVNTLHKASHVLELKDM